MTDLSDGMRYSGKTTVYVFEGPLDFANDPEALGAFIDSGEASRHATFTGTWSNTVTNSGRQQFTKLICGETASLGNYIGLTTSLTTPSLAATTLTDEISRKACSITASYLTYYQRKVAYFTTTDFTSTGIAGEAIFDTATTGGTMWAINSITVSKSSTQSLVVSHLIQATS